MAIGTNLQKLWSAWNIRSLLILSICIQVVLAYAAPLRRQTSRGFTVAVVWSTYLLADWAALYVFGLISNTVRNSTVTPSEVNQSILALWASFLLIHMGGPDTITAYSLEDNSLWLRHLMRLVAQLCLFCYIFLKTFPDNKLVAPTILVLATGVIKYGERTWALFLASLDNLKSSKPLIGSLPTDGQPAFLPQDSDNTASTKGRNTDRVSETEKTKQDPNQLAIERKEAAFFCERFRRIIVDIMPSYSELQTSREFFQGKGAQKALNVISRELNIMYEVLYTKILAIYSRWGKYSQSLFCINMVAALVLFFLSRKDQFDGVDVRITYCLLAGAFLVDLNRRRMLLNSDWSHANRKILGLCNTLMDLPFQYLDIILHVVVEVALHCFRIRGEKLWSETIGAFNLLSYCFKKHGPRQSESKVTECCRNIFDKAIEKCGLAERLDKMKYVEKKAFKEELWAFIFDELRGKALLIDSEEKAREVYESRGELVLEKRSCDELIPYVKDFDYDKELLSWHIATEICCNIDDNESDCNKEFSKTLSDYMMYLLIHRPKMMSPVAGIGLSRYSDTCFQLKRMVTELGVEDLKGFSRKVFEDSEIIKPVHKKQDEDKSVLLDAFRLAQMLRDKNKKWETIVRVWVEILSYAAGHCRADAHARVLSEGGELMTHVWLLMTHFGIVAYWPKQDGLSNLPVLDSKSDQPIASEV